MNIQEIFGIEGAIRFVEPEFAAQTDTLFNGALAAAGGDELLQAVAGTPRYLARTSLTVLAPPAWASRAK